MNTKTIFLLLVLVTTIAVSQKRMPDKSAQRGAQKDAAGLSWQVLNINNLWTWHRSDGEGNHSPGGEDGMSYPIFTGRCVYEDNIVFGGIMYVNNWPENGGTKAVNQPIRVNGGTYLSHHGMVQGWVTGSGAGADYTSSTNDPLARIYRIRRDYKEMSSDELQRDASIFYEQLSATSAWYYMIEAITEQYDKDWNEWPVQYGAPFIDRNGNGVYDPPPRFDPSFTLDSLVAGNYDEPGISTEPNGVPADQVLYAVYNGLDRPKTLVFAGSEPIGLEIQKTVWGYKPSTELSEHYFVRYRLINKGGIDTTAGKKGTFYIDSLFVGQWVDSDIGNAGDDLTGCDTLLHLGFAYNANQVDISYNRFSLPPPSAGYTFLQGPLVPGAPSDSGTMGFRRVQGKRNLGMTSFGYLKASSALVDPPFSDYSNGSGRWWNILRGFMPIGSLLDPPLLYQHPPGFPITQFPLSGDPVTQTGFVDGLGTTYSLAPGDVRFLVSGGPSRLAPGDTAEVITAVAVGLGPDHLSSVSIMKQNIQKAREAFRSFARAPDRASVSVSELNKEIILDWGRDTRKIEQTENHISGGSYRFEGYNVYQIPSYGAPLSEGTRIATFDLKNGVKEILSYILDRDQGFSGTAIVQRGTDSGIKRSISLRRDYLEDGPMYNGREYFYAITAYNYSPDGTKRIRTFESDPRYVKAVPQIPFGVQISTQVGDSVTINRVSGQANGTIAAVIYDPRATKGHVYEIRFDTAGGHRAIVKDATLGADVYVGSLPASGENLIAHIDGLQIEFSDQLDLRLFLVTANALGPLVPPEMGAFAFNSSGFPFYYNGVNPFGDRPDGSRQQSSGLTSNQGWGIHVGGTGNVYTYAQFKKTISNNDSTWERIRGNDFELRFTGVGGQAYNGTLGSMMSIPFEIWNAGSDSATTSDDYRMIPVVYDGNGNGVFDYDGIDHSISGLDDDPETDWISWYDPVDRSPGQTGYNAWVSSSGTSGLGDLVMADMVLVLWNDGSVSDPAFPANVSRSLPETGTVFRIATQRPFGVNDLFSFATPSVHSNSAILKSSARRVGVYPNPYFAGWSYDGESQQRTYVTFNNLPPRVKILIFNLAGHLVRTLEKNDPSQFLRWDLTNEHNWQIGSGIYICHVEMLDIGETKIIKLAVVLSEAPPTY